MNNKIQNDLKPLYNCYAQYKMLFDYYRENKTVRSKEEIEARLEYIKKNRVKQRNEIETLLWLLNVEEEE